MNKKTGIAEEIVKVLNHNIELDKEAFNKLFTTRFPVNDSVANDPYIVVTPDKKMGTLGILNMVMNIYGESLIAGEFDIETGELERFCLYKPEKIC